MGREDGVTEDSARDTYQAFASIYDDFNYRNDYEMWFGALLPELERRGLRRGRLLDVGCGTGRAFEPMLRRGWEIQGCDVSTAMLEQAERKYGEAVPLAVADARELPVFGEFELVWALNDVVNYLTGDGDLERALAGMRSNLAADGMVLFDSNTLSLFRSDFASGDSAAMSVGEWRWHGVTSEIEPGGTYEARVSGAGVETHVHRERHYPPEMVRTTMEAAGLEFLVALGQQEEDGQVVLLDPPDEARDHKIIYIGRSATGRDASDADA
jgi:SAM-dependent methyltransferase